MEYLSLGNGHLVSIMFPLVIIFNKIIDFQAMYFNRKYEKMILILGTSIGAIGSGVLHRAGFSNYFCFIWAGLFTIVLYSQLILNYLINKKEHINKGCISECSIVDDFFGIINIISGVIIIGIPYSPFYSYISGGNEEIKTIIISKTIITILGLSYILLNKKIIFLIWSRLEK